MVLSNIRKIVWKRVQGWMEQSLSAGGKEVLIKAVAQAIPAYSMSCFRLPRGLCKHMAGTNRWLGERWQASDQEERIYGERNTNVMCDPPVVSAFAVHSSSHRCPHTGSF